VQPLPGGRSSGIAKWAIGLLAFAALAAAVAPASAPAQILNTAGVNNGVTQTTWLESFATVGESSSPANTLRVSMIVQHPVGREVTGLKFDDNWDGDGNDLGSTKSVTAQQPNVTGGYAYSRVTFSYVIPTGGTDMSCDTFSGTRRNDNNSVYVRAVMDDATETATSSSRIKFIAAGNCQGIGGEQDFGSIRSWGGSNFNQSIEPGDSINFTYTCDDPDTDVLSSDDECGGVRWRRRNVMTGATSATATDCVDGGDNTTKNTPVTFPDRGRWVVEAETLEEDCGTSSGSYWFPIGAADVNSAAAPSITPSPNTTRPNTNGNVVVTSALGADPDSGDGGHAEYVEWDKDNDGGFDDEVDRAGPTSAFGSNPTSTINTTGMTPGTHTVRARVTDNGAMGGADNIRRTSGAASTTFTVNSPPVPNAQTFSTESHLAKAFTLTGTDANSDPLTYDIVTNPLHGDICTTASGGCTEGTGANRFYRPDGNFAGTDTFTVRAFDDHNGQSAGTATVTVNVTPQTNITAGPDDPSGSAGASFNFSTPVTGSPAVTFECRLDSNQETDFAACTSPRVYSGLLDGEHTFEVRARRGTFVDPTPAEHEWTLDSTAPETFIDTNPNNPTSSDSANFTFHSNDGDATFECRRDGEAPTGTGWGTCTSPKLYTGLAEGSHTFEVRATDEFDRTDPIPASYTWEIDLTAPAVAIDSAPDDPTNETTAAFGFSSSDPTATFQCKLDSGSFSTCTSPRSYPGLLEGEHTFTVVATDPAGNTGPEESHTWDIDTTVPETTIDDGPPPETATDVASFLFSSNDPGAGFECRVDSTDPGDWEECSPPQLYADLGDGPHAVEVRATDAAGNKDASPDSRSWTVDTTAPQTTIDSSPPNPSGSADAEFGFSSPDAGAGFECKLDADDWAPCTSTVSHVGLADGPHVFRVKATDALDNTDATPATRSWTIDTTGPTTTIDDGPPSQSGSDAASVDFSADEPGDFECRVDSTEELDFQDCTSPAALSALDDGPHSFDIRATDTLGNAGAAVTHSWTVDTTPPDVQITTGMPATTSSAAASFEFTSTDGTAGFQCSLNGGPWNACSSPRNYTGLDEGSHTFDVRARDAVGNVSAVPASDSWSVVDSGPPNTQINSAPPASTESTSAAFGFSASEPSDFECAIDGGAFSACGSGTSGTKSYTGLGVGGHTFEVRSEDADGNVDQTPASFTWLVDAVATGGVAGAAAQSPLITAGKGPLRKGKGVAATIGCPTGPCTVSRKKAKLKVGGTSFVARVKSPSSLPEGSTTKVNVKLTAAARAALAAAGVGRLTLKLTVGSAGGTVSKKIKLKVSG
jgi:hypothetical protein